MRDQLLQFLSREMENREVLASLKTLIKKLLWAKTRQLSLVRIFSKENLRKTAAKLQLS
jgi:hypothetical protein